MFARRLLLATLAIAGCQIPSPELAEHRSPLLPPASVQISFGEKHACAVQTDGALSCWGDNSSGQLGQGDLDARSTPASIAGVWSRVAAGGGHSCALEVDGTLWCWGANGSGQLGIGNTTRQTRPVQVTGTGADAAWIAISAGDKHTCGVQSSGNLYCFGDNARGQLGDGTQLTRSTPVQIAGTTWSEITAGGSHTCALRTSGELACWGANSSGQLGDGLNYLRTTPFTVPSGASTWINAGAGGSHTCAVRADGTAWCWGSNVSGQLGVSSNDPDRRTPAIVAGGRLWSRMIAGSHHSCGQERGTTNIYCFGENTTGALGDGTTSSKRAPSLIAGAWAELGSAGGRASSARTAAGGLYVWGSNAGGQLGRGAIGSSLFYRPIAGTGVLRAGAQHACVLRADATIECFGLGSSGQLGDGTFESRDAPVRVAGSGYTALSVGANHACALRGTELSCWGNNAWSQLGDGTTSNRPAPVVIGGVWSAVSAGRGNFTMAVDTTGRLFAWGANELGRMGLGISAPARIATPMQVGGSDAWIAVAAGLNHACALDDQGAIYCSGQNKLGQLGLGDLIDRSLFTRAGSDSNWVAIYAGDHHSAGLRSDGSLYTWGANSMGQLGLGSNAASVSTPTREATMSAWSNVALGAMSSAAIRTSGELYTWGQNLSGELGLGNTTRRRAPVQVTIAGISSFSSVAAGAEFSCAAGGASAFCTGLNLNGQLGNDTAFEPSPVVLFAAPGGEDPPDAGAPDAAAPDAAAPDAAAPDAPAADAGTPAPDSGSADPDTGSSADASAPDAGPVNLLPATLPPARACEYYEATVTAVGGTGTISRWSTRPTFPPGLTIEGSGMTGTIKGYPRRASAGVYNFRVRVDEPTGGFDLQPYTITVDAPDPDRQKYGVLVGDLDTDAFNELFAVDLCSPPFTRIPLNPPRPDFAGVNHQYGPGYAELSPDGARIAFSGTEFSADTDIYVGTLSSTVPHSAIKLGGANNGYPVGKIVWAPDSSKLAVVGYYSANGVYVSHADASGNFGPLVNASGPLVAGGAIYDQYPIRFSPDSQKLGFLADADVDYQQNLYLVDVSTPVPGPRMRIGPTPSDPSVSVYGDWTWSPDSTRVYYERHVLGPPHARLMYVDVSGPTLGTPIEIAAPAPYPEMLDFHALSPDGTKIMFTAGTFSVYDFRLFLADVSGPTPVFIGPVSPAPPPGGGVSGGTWSPDSTRFLYRGEVITDGVHELVMVDVSGAPPFTPHVLHPVPGTRAFSESWSPDGTKIGFGDSSRHPLIADVSGPPPWPTSVATNMEAFLGTWTPDGAFRLHSGAHPNPGLLLVDLSAPTVLIRLSSGELQWYGWDVSGQRAYFRGPTPTLRAWMVDLHDRTTQHPLVPSQPPTRDVLDMFLPRLP